jgi:ADP-ribosyl-[dinitrogen reductase] hydrolase
MWKRTVTGAAHGSAAANETATVGSLLGTAVGDAIGLPYEGLSARRRGRLFRESGRHHLLAGRGMVSDDTEHACFTAQALITSGGDLHRFRRRLARSLRWWLLGLPAGVGLATARAILKLWVGVPPTRSGVYSAGNGPAMRAPILGVALGADPERLKAFVGASTALTHSDPRAHAAALAVALAAHLGASGRLSDAASYRQALAGLLSDAAGEELLGLVDRAASSAQAGESLAVFARAIGSRGGVSGYSYHTVPCVLQVWFRFGDDFARGLMEVVEAGGDTDTSGAIFGGLVGARVGPEGIPADWRDGIVEWPRSLGWIERLGQALARGTAPPGYFWPGVLVRNAVFLVVVLAHGLRRLLPPY